MIPWSVALLAVGVSVALNGCSTDATALNLAPATASTLGPAAARRSTAETPEPALRVYFAPLQDERLDPSSLGNVGARAYVAHAAPTWIEQGLQSMTGGGFAMVATPDEAQLHVTPRLLKLYVHNVDVTKSAVVVLALTFTRDGAPAGQRTYRGRHASMNWWSSDAELTGALQAALADALHAIRADLEARARQPR